MEKLNIYYCDFCNDRIFPDEAYIENLDGKYAHYGCLDATLKACNWLGFNIKYMEDETI